jgi:aspartyl-tRNA(Asn)/glutamyl-tRNA(Gln) amidotransferase subunit C
MSTSEIDVSYVAHLARIHLTPEEANLFGPQLSHVLEYAEKLKELDVSGVEPTAHAFKLVNVTRPDEVTPAFLGRRVGQCAGAGERSLHCS